MGETFASSVVLLGSYRGYSRGAGAAMIKLVQAVDYQGDYAYARGSVPAVVNLASLDFAVLLPRENTRNQFDDITRLYFCDESHLDVFGKPEDFVP